MLWPIVAVMLKVISIVELLVILNVLTHWKIGRASCRERV